MVSLYAEDEKLSTQTVPLIAAQSSITLEWEQSFSTSDFVPIKVVIDETNVLDEINELNNFAIRPIIVGDFVLPGGIEITASLTPVQLEPNKLIRITGSAIYFGIEEGVDPDVAGATVKAIISGGNSGQTYTRSDGTFDLYLTVPNTPGIYSISGDITDYTLSADFGPLSFEVIEAAPMPDLISSISLDQTTILQGEQVSGIATVTNRGNLTAENFVFKYYNCEMNIGEQTIASLAPGETLQFPFTVTVNAVSNCFNPGNCPFVAFADSEFQVAESSENNNTSQRNLTVLPGKPDLTPQKTFIGTYVKMAEPVSFSVRLDNIGGVTSGAFAANVYSDGILIHTENVSELASCGNTSFNVNYTFPTLDDHVITVKVDEAAVVDEFSETNNFYTKTVKNLVIIQEPNLQIEVADLSVLPVLPGEGENFEISANFRNKGTAAVTSPFDINFIVTEAGVNRSETLRISENVAVGQVINRKITTSLATNGNHKLQVILDSGNEIVEKSKGDNTAAGLLCLDFKPGITGSVWNGGFYRDTQQYLTVILQNLGLFTAENVSVKFYLDNQEIAASTVSSVGPYGKSSGSVGISLPYIFDKDGVFELSVRVDDPGSYTECNEENNIFSKSIVVKPPMPDLRVISEYISPTELNPDLDEPINIFLSYDNVGVMRSDAFIARVAVDDVQLGQDISIPALNPGENGTIAIAAPYSSAIGGIRIIRGFVDPDNLIAESNETNNEASRAIIIGDAPNLFFTGLDIDFNCPENGEEVNITATIENEGDLGTEAEIQFYYLNESDTIPIERKNIIIEPNGITNTSINWTVVNNTFSVYAEILETSQPEFDVLDNSIRSEFCSVDLYALNVNTAGQGIVKKNPNNRGYEIDADVEIKAIPAEGWYFEEWIGDLSGNLNPSVISMSRNKEITAVFKLVPEEQFSLIINIQGEGSVSKFIDKATYLPGEEVSLQATPAEGWVFVEWRQDLSGSTNPINLNISGNTSITAVFVPVLGATYESVDSSCVGSEDGSINLSVNGGTIPYTFTWSTDIEGKENPFSTEKDLQNLSSGNYTVEITDLNGLIKILNIAVNVSDTEPPVVVFAENVKVILDENGNGVLSSAIVDGGSTDNCAIKTIEIDKTSFSCTDLGSPNITLTVTDVSNNSSSLTRQILVVDEEAPVISAPVAVTANTSNDLGYDCTTTVSLGSPIVNDNCSTNPVKAFIGEQEIDPTTHLFGTGETTVRWVVTDLAGNTAYADQIITVIDDEKPIAIAKDISIALNAEGLASLSAEEVNNESSDNCGVENMFLDIYEFTCDDIGEKIISLTVRDVNGNESTVELIVTVTSGDYEHYTLYFDFDGDGYGLETDSIESCTEYVENYIGQAGDCNDEDRTIHPGATETANDGIDQDCDGQDLIIENQGCSAEFWKSNAFWCSTYNQQHDFFSTFGITNTRGISDRSGSLTLLTSLDGKKGDFGKLAQQATAALLNACDPNINYSYDTAQIIAEVRELFDNPANDKSHAKLLMEKYLASNNAVCPGGGVVEEGEGCSADFWISQEHWCAKYLRSSSFFSVFGITDSKGIGSMELTLLEALNLKGGGYSKLAKEATAALLNACHQEVNYPLTEEQILIGTREIFNDPNSKNPDANNLGNLYVGANSANCPSITSSLRTAISSNEKPLSVVEKEESSGLIQSQDKITVYPNPLEAAGFWIHFGNVESAETYYSTIYNFNGRKLAEKEFNVNPEENRHFWNLDHGTWGQGVYILRVSSGNKVYQVRLIK